MRVVKWSDIFRLLIALKITVGIWIVIDPSNWQNYIWILVFLGISNLLSWRLSFKMPDSKNKTEDKEENNQWN